MFFWLVPGDSNKSAWKNFTYNYNYLQAHGSKRSKSKVHPGNEEILATVTDKYSIICRLEKTLVCAVNAFEMFNSTSVARKRAPPFLLYGVHSFKSF